MVTGRVEECLRFRSHAFSRRARIALNKNSALVAATEDIIGFTYYTVIIMNITFLTVVIIGVK